MTATADAEAAANELMPLAEYLGSVLRRLRALPPLDLDLTQAHGNVLAGDVLAPHPYPAFDQAAIDGYAARWEDLASAGRIGSHPSFGAFEGGPRPDGVRFRIRDIPLWVTSSTSSELEAVIVSLSLL